VTVRRETSAQRLLGAFTEALDVLDADPKLVRVLTRVRTEMIPELRVVAARADEVLERLGSLGKKIHGGESDAEIVSDSEEG
jgi:hypothetical protein